jgi:uncharacterized protein Yka (UPF0111/DUF47 family)
MRILVELIEKMDDTMDEIEFYAEKAHAIRHDHKELADVYIKIASEHIEIYKMLHTEAVELIDDERRSGKAVPSEMEAIWRYEHERLVKEFAEAKYLVSEYK